MKYPLIVIRLTQFLLVGLISLAIPAGYALAQARALPAEARTGNLTMGVFPVAAVNGKPVRFSPGARILNQANQLVLPASVTGKVPIAYILDFQGQIKQAWLVTNAEITALNRRKR
ncbi:MAG: hypothetical protein WBD34_24460 [Burkholderiaceae bacterium]